MCRAFAILQVPPAPVTDEQNAAATKLQAAQRGRAARANVGRLKADKAAAEAAAREAAAAADDAQQEATDATEAEQVHPKH